MASGSRWVSGDFARPDKRHVPPDGFIMVEPQPSDHRGRPADILKPTDQPGGRSAETCGPPAQVSDSARRLCGVLWTADRAGDHLGTTRYACDRTIRRSPPAVCARLNASELRRRLLPRSGGQGVAGSNPAVPTVFRTLVPRTGNEVSHDRSHLDPSADSGLGGVIAGTWMPDLASGRPPSTGRRPGSFRPTYTLRPGSRWLGVVRALASVSSARFHGAGVMASLQPYAHHMASTAQAYSRSFGPSRRAIGNASSTTCRAWAVWPVNSRATEAGKAASSRVSGSRAGWPSPENSRHR
jgi:hypothetical protein